MTVPEDLFEILDYSVFTEYSDLQKPLKTGNYNSISCWCPFRLKGKISQHLLILRQFYFI